MTVHTHVQIHCQFTILLSKMRKEILKNFVRKHGKLSYLIGDKEIVFSLQGMNLKLTYSITESEVLNIINLNIDNHVLSLWRNGMENNELYGIGGPGFFGIVEGSHRIEGLIKAFILLSEFETDEDEYTATNLTDFSFLREATLKRIPFWNKMADLFVIQ